MDYRLWLKEAMRKHKIKASVLSRESGVQERQISLFFNGKDLMAGSFFKLVDAMERLAPGSMFPNSLQSDIEIVEQISQLADKLKRNVIENSSNQQKKDDMVVAS